MADQKITELTAHTAGLSTDDLLVFVNDPSGTPETKGTTLANVVKWASYTPTLTATVTNPTIGNGALAGRYLQVGTIVFFQISWVFGSTSAAGDGSYSFALPVTAAASSGGSWFARLLDAGTRYYGLGAFLNSTTTIGFAQLDTSGAAVTHSSPITWATGDALAISGFYEAA